MHTVASVKYLNARLLVDGLEMTPGISLINDVPSSLLETLVNGHADVALCPVIDYQISPRNLVIVPAGGIGSDGATLTVRVFSSSPLDGLHHVFVDGDSHTSTALLQVVFEEFYGRRLELSPLDDNSDSALLLIGDKVVRNEPNPAVFPYQLDLGEAWKQITGLPFVFATWMARADADLDGLPSVLVKQRETNRHRIEEIVAASAQQLGWTDQLANTYLRDILRYEIGPRELDSMQLFWRKCHELDLIPQLRPLTLYGETSQY